MFVDYGETVVCVYRKVCHLLSLFCCPFPILLIKFLSIPRDVNVVLIVKVIF